MEAVKLQSRMYRAMMIIAAMITGLTLFGLTGTMDYEDERAGECHAQGYLYDRINDKCRLGE